MTTKLRAAQLDVLRVFAEGGGPGESWAQYFDGMSSSALAWANHERMLDALTAAGLIDGNGITDAGRVALAYKGRRVILAPGTRFGRLVVREHVEGQARHVCTCDCGNTVTTRTAALTAGCARSCGCLVRERMSRLNRKHGHTPGGKSSPTHVSWTAMLGRCYRPACNGYERYGGRGIMVCDRWRGAHGFENFLADMGPRPSRAHSLDRIDGAGHYEPSNCRWATRTEQTRNRRNTCRITVNGETLTASEWAARLGVRTSVVHTRLRYGWSEQEAVTRPARRYRKDPSHV